VFQLVLKHVAVGFKLDDWFFNCHNVRLHLRPVRNYTLSVFESRPTLFYTFFHVSTRINDDEWWRYEYCVLVIISLWNSKRLQRKVHKNFRALPFCRTLYIGEHETGAYNLRSSSVDLRVKIMVTTSSWCDWGCYFACCFSELCIILVWWLMKIFMMHASLNEYRI